MLHFKPNSKTLSTNLSYTKACLSFTAKDKQCTIYKYILEGMLIQEQES